jgi:hypothetical protein
VAAGTSQTLTLTTTRNSTFNAAITFTATGLPTGVTAQFLPASIVSAPGAGGITLTFSATSRATAKTYPITISATGGGVTQRQNLTLDVTGAVRPASEIETWK